MAYIPRLSTQTPTPMQGNPWYYSDNWYYLNGYGLPNCTCYAYGRFNENRNTTQPSVSLRTAKYWWTDPPMDAFERGQTPALGAIACWANPDPSSTAPGHVAIVEQIHADGSITISESGWNAWYFHTNTLTRGSGYVADWMRSSARQYRLQGFFYLPGTQPGSPVWHAYSTNSGSGDVGYEKESTEAFDNAVIIWSVLYSYGWTLNAVCGLLGNIDAESSYNPWCWQSPVPYHNDTSVLNNDSIGYGLVQWTPPNKYIDSIVSKDSPYYAPHFKDIQGNPNDGYAQLYAIENQTDQYYSTAAYPETYDEYKHSTKQPDYLASAWMCNYERAGGLEERRRTAAIYWYGMLQNIAPFDPFNPQPIIRVGNKMPLWFYLRPNTLL